MNKKALTTSFLSIILIFSIFMSGCSSESSLTEKEGKNNEKGENVTLDIFQFKVEFKDQFEELAEKYKKENSNVTININTVGGGENYGSALKSKFASGKEPAIFNIGGPQDVKDWRDSLADLSDTEAAGKALEGTLDGVTADGKVLGLPFNQEGYGFLYNKEIFKKAGIKGEEIKDLKSLEAAIKTLDSKKKDLDIEAVFALPGKEKWVTGLHLANTFIAPEFDGNVIKAFEAKNIDFKYGDAFKKILDLQNKYSVQPTLSLDYPQQVEELFSFGKVAIIQQGNWVYNSIADIDEEFAANHVGLLPIPVEGYAEDHVPVGVPMYWGINSNQDEKVVKEAKKFIDWMYTSEAGKEAVLNDFKFIPAYDGYDSSKISDPLSKAVYEYSTAGKTIGWTFMGFPTGWGENELGVNIQKYLSGEADWNELVTDSKKKWAESRK